MSLMRGDYENAAEYLRQRGRSLRRLRPQHQPLVRVVAARDHRAAGDAARQARRGAGHRRRDRASRPTRRRRKRSKRELIAAEALLSADRVDDAEHRLTQVESRARSAHHARRVGRVPAAARRPARAPDAHHRGVPRHRAELERLRAGRRALSGRGQPARARRASPRKAGARSTADRHYQYAAQVFQSLGATRDLEEVRAAMAAAPDAGHRRVRRLARRRRRCAGAAAGRCGGAAGPARARAGRDAARSRHRRRHRRVRRAAGRRRARDRARRHRRGRRAHASRGSPSQGARLRRRQPRSSSRSAASPTARAPSPSPSTRPLGHPLLRRVRMMAAVARQGFDLCGARDRPTAAIDVDHRAPARAAAARVSSAPAPRCTASSIRFSGCRATTSRC